MIRVFNGGFGISQQSKETLLHCTNCIEIFSITRRIPKSEHHAEQEMPAISVAAAEEPAINTLMPDSRGNLYKFCKVHTF